MAIYCTECGEPISGAVSMTDGATLAHGSCVGRNLGGLVLTPPPVPKWPHEGAITVKTFGTGYVGSEKEMVIADAESTRIYLEATRGLTEEQVIRGIGVPHCLVKPSPPPLIAWGMARRLTRERAEAIAAEHPGDETAARVAMTKAMQIGA
jgi:hypothetical protein